ARNTRWGSGSARCWRTTWTCASGSCSRTSTTTSTTAAASRCRSGSEAGNRIPAPADCRLHAIESAHAKQREVPEVRGDEDLRVREPPARPRVVEPAARADRVLGGDPAGRSRNEVRHQAPYGRRWLRDLDLRWLRL